MNETKQAPQRIVALFDTLAGATAALDALERAGVPYANTTMTSHNGSDLPEPLGTTHAEQVWSVEVLVGEPLHSTAQQILRGLNTLALGTEDAPLDGRDEAERGGTAWGHYVFEPVAATDQVGEAAGTSGTTGIAADATAENKPAVDDVPDQARG